MKTKTQIAKNFIAAVEKCNLSPELASEILHNDYLQVEYPNLLNQKGQKSNIEESFSRLEMARKILKSQTYEISSTIEKDNTVVIESIWKGELNDGRKLKAFFCMIFEFQEEKIYRIRNYDCFEGL